MQLPLLSLSVMIRSQLEYANSVWNPHLKEDMEIIEKVQMHATKLVESVKHLSYEDRLKKLEIPTFYCSFKIQKNERRSHRSI